jgi:23S rRNA (uridine2552-2'-O)-methyltransferase
LLAMMGGRADVVLSDMAANTTGHRKTDQLRILGLVEGAAAFAADVLNPGGTFVAKVFQSGADATLMTQLKHDFATVKHVKPASSRKDSSERYVLAMGFRACRGSRHRPSFVIASEAKQSSSVLAIVDCFVASLLALTS